jgi:hypothetical protein
LDHIITCSEQTTQRIQWLCQLESRPFTLNDHNYLDYRDKFRAHYRSWRAENPTLMNGISIPVSPLRRSDIVGPTPHDKVMTGLRKIGLNVTLADLAKLLPPDPMDAALEIMACVCAYFQGESSMPEHPDVVLDGVRVIQLRPTVSPIMSSLPSTTSLSWDLTKTSRWPCLKGLVSRAPRDDESAKNLSKSHQKSRPVERN